jgi:hypothetical protein
LAPYICLICPSTVLISTLSDFYNWNRVYVRYCDGASFSGDAEGRAQVIFSESCSDIAVLVAWSGDVLLVMM